jgi:hypothetical protein
MLPAQIGSCGEQARRGTDPSLEISKNIWTDNSMHGLLEQWLIPTIVDRVIRDLLNSGQ